MTIDFTHTIKTHVLPLFPGSIILDESPQDTPSTGRLNCSIGNGNLTLILRKDLTSGEHLTIKRKQQFTRNESKVVDLFIKEIIEFDAFTHKEEYKETLYSKCLEVSIVKSIASNPRSIEQAIDLCNYWSSRTYEGAATSFAIKLPPLLETSRFELNHLKLDFFASITNGYDTCVRLNDNGKIDEYLTLTNIDATQNAPFRFLQMCNASTNGLVVALTKNSTILIFKDGALLWAKKNGKWVYYDHETCKKRIAGGSRRTDINIRNSMYLSALDVSYTKTGGILACIDAGKVSAILRDGLIHDNDLIENASSEKSIAVKSIIGDRKFHELHRALRSELASMDGAFIFDTSGNIIAVGAIIKIPGGSYSGGRAAATMALSNYGTAIKISNDTYIDCKRNGNSVFYVA